MKTIFTAIFAIAITSMTFGQTIVGSPHDFSGATWNTATSEICITCHTPHNAVTGLVAPLWNHEVTTATYTIYDNTVSPTFDATAGQPDGASLLCLSCHDGTVALENFGGVTTGTNLISGTALVGTDLSNDHPVSFVYNDALATTDGGLYPPTTSNSGLGGTIDNDMLFATKMQCASCHDAHGTIDNTVGGGLLVKSNAASALCLTCHNK